MSTSDAYPKIEKLTFDVSDTNCSGCDSEILRGTPMVLIKCWRSSVGWERTFLCKSCSKTIGKILE